MDSPFSHWSNFRYWSCHVSLNAAPSFIIACAISSPPLDARIAGMTAGVATFIAGYTCMTGSPWFRRKVSGTSFGNAVRLATRIRTTLALIGLIGSLGYIHSLKAPFLNGLALLEVYAGLFAGQIVESTGKTDFARILRTGMTGTDPIVRAKSWWLGDMHSAIPTFLWTVTEGALLSLLMASIAMLIWLISMLKRRYSRNSPV